MEEVGHRILLVVVDTRPAEEDSHLAVVDAHLVVVDAHTLAVEAAGHILVAAAVEAGIRLVAVHTRWEHHTVLEVEHHTDPLVVRHSLVRLEGDFPVRPWCRMKNR